MKYDWSDPTRFARTREMVNRGLVAQPRRSFVNVALDSIVLLLISAALAGIALWLLGVDPTIHTH